MRKEYVYREEDYTNVGEHSYYVRLMERYDFAPEEIYDENKFEIAFEYFLNLLIKSPDFLPAYEHLLRMIERLEDDQETEMLKLDIEQRWYSACARIVTNDQVYDKQVEWEWVENRPLIRGLYQRGLKMWQSEEFESANTQFKKLLEIIPRDNVGARYAEKATLEQMKYSDYRSKFIEGGFYRMEELESWFGEN